MPVEVIGGGATSGGTLTIRIASSTARADEIAVADYVCDGVNDQTDFATAISTADAENANGITLELSSGIFYFGAEWNIPNTVGSVAVIGRPASAGWNNSTWIEKSATGNYGLIDQDNPNLTIMDVGFYGLNTETITEAMIQLPSSGKLRLDRCQVYGAFTTGADLISLTSGNTVHINECYLTSDKSCLKATSGVITTFITNSWLYSIGAATIDCQGLSEQQTNGATIGEWRIVGCMLVSENTAVVRLDGALANKPRLFMQGCGIDTETAGVDGVYVTEFTPILIGNRFAMTGAGTAVRCGTLESGEITGNYFDEVGQHGIWLLDCDKVTVSGNTLRNYSDVTDNTYSGILLDGNTNYCMVTGNTLQSLGTNKALYGIRVDDSTCDNNRIENNNLVSSAKTAGNEFSDAGTATLGWQERELRFFSGTLATTAPDVKRNRFTAPAVLGLTYLDCNTAPTTQAIIVDVHKNGTTVYTTQGNRPQIAASATAGNSTTLPDVKTIAAGDYLTADIDQVGSGTTGADLVVIQRYMPL